MSASNWALSAASRFVEHERIRNEQWASTMQKRQTIVSQAPALWEQVRQAIQTQVRCFNEHVGRQVMTVHIQGNGKLTVCGRTETGPRTMTLTFDAGAPSVLCKINSAEGNFEFEGRYLIDLKSGGGGLVARSGRVECSAEEVAGDFLNRFMGWN